MKVIRFQHKKTGRIELGIQTETGILPLSGFMENAPHSMLELFSTPFWKSIANLHILTDGPILSPDEITFLPPIARPGKILCVGLNYRDHVLEGGRDIPNFPTIFLKASSSIVAHRQAIQIPVGSTMVDLEAELAVVIGKVGKNVPAKDAYEHIAGYTILNDVSERDYQKRTSQWTMGKSCDTFSPIGPVLVSKDEITDPHTLEITGSLNGNVLQHSNTRHLIFTVPYLIEYISKMMTLEPGDIISTGTPGGVGVFRDPPIFLKAGDEVEISIQGIGTLRNPVI